MAKVTVVILTKDRAALLERALGSITKQTFLDFEVLVIDDGSVDSTPKILANWSLALPLRIVRHEKPMGIVKSRQEALQKAGGEFVAFLDDDDQWLDENKLSKQLEWFNKHPRGVLCGGGIAVKDISGKIVNKFRSDLDANIRRTMLFRNNFFTSTVMIKRSSAFLVGGFVNDGFDLAEDYDLWLRMGKIGEMGNIKEVFTLYAKSSYNKSKFRMFLKKQSRLIRKNKKIYPFFVIAQIVILFRIIVGK